MSAATRLQEWRDEEKRLTRKAADAHLLSPEMRSALYEDIERCQSRVRFFEAEVELEKTQQEIAAFKRDAA